MRVHSMLLTSAAFALMAASAAEARPSIGPAGHRAGGSAAGERPQETASLFEAIALLMGIGVSAKASPVVGTDAPRSAAPGAAQCEEEKKRAEAAKAAETRRTAEAERARARGSEPLYLAF